MMPWPSPQDYNEAIQNPATSLLDPELRATSPECNRLGLPVCVSGAFASVYHLHENGRNWAVRCFLHPLKDRKERYERISDFVVHDDLSYTVSFQFLEEGVRIHGTTYPILRMDWVQGEAFGSYVRRHRADSELLLQLAESFKRMVERLQQAGVAHGDLQHDNIMMVGNELILVDYDGLFVPALTGMEASELGHRNYQHPSRTKSHFGVYLDNFSAWVIYLSLRCLANAPELWSDLKGGDDCLLLRQQDYSDPLNSSAFMAMETHSEEKVRRSSRYLRSLLSCSVDDLPPIYEEVPDVKVPDMPGLDYGRAWYLDGTGTGAPVAQIRSLPEKNPVVVEAVSEDAEAVTWTGGGSRLSQSTQAVSGQHDLKGIVKSADLLPQKLREIRSELRAVMPSDEHFVWTGETEFEKSKLALNAPVPSFAFRPILLSFAGVFFVLAALTRPFSLSSLGMLFFVLAFIYSPLLLQVVLAEKSYTAIKERVSPEFKNCWYAITNKRVFIVSAKRRPDGSYVTREQHIPFSEIGVVRVNKPDGTVHLIARHFFRLPQQSDKKELRLSGLKGKQVKKLVAALPSTVSIEFLYKISKLSP